jgi:hypothetical protein
MTPLARTLPLVALLTLPPALARADEPPAAREPSRASSLTARSLRNAGIYVLTCSGIMAALGVPLLVQPQPRGGPTTPFIVGAVIEGVAGAEVVLGSVALGVGQRRLAILEQQAAPRGSAADRTLLTAAASR